MGFSYHVLINSHDIEIIFLSIWEKERLPRERVEKCISSILFTTSARHSTSALWKGCSQLCREKELCGITIKTTKQKLMNHLFTKGRPYQSGAGAGYSSSKTQHSYQDFSPYYGRMIRKNSLSCPSLAMEVRRQDERVKNYFPKPLKSVSRPCSSISSSSVSWML